MDNFSSVYEQISKIDPITDDQKNAIKFLEEENQRLRKTIRVLKDKLNARNRTLNKYLYDSYDDCTHNRDEY